MAKTVRISPVGAGTYNTLPGASGERSAERGQIEDTVLGQTFQSNDAGLGTWQITGPAYYKGYVGYKATIKKAGTSTSTTGAALSNTSGQIYQLDTVAQRLMDRNAGITVYDNAVDETANVEWYDYLWGRVKFLDTYTVTGPVTMDYSYFPVATMGRGKSYTLTMTANNIDTSDFPTVQSNSGWMTNDPGLRQVALEMSGIFDASADLLGELEQSNELVIEVCPDGADLAVARGFFRCVSESQSGNVGALEQEDVSFQLNVPSDDKMLTPFSWTHDAGSTLPQAVRDILDAWQNETKVDVQYLYDGTNGKEGTAVVTECTLSGGMESMNEFTITLLGDGDLTTVP